MLDHRTIGMSDGSSVRLQWQGSAIKTWYMLTNCENPFTSLHALLEEESRFSLQTRETTDLNDCHQTSTL